MKKLLLLCGFGFAAYLLSAQTILPSLISDGMVLQRDSELKVWGWDNPGQELSVKLAGKNYQTAASEKGLWEVRLPPMQPGETLTLIVKGSQEIKVSDILVGDVWVCSGQSNMELNMNRASALYGREIAESENDNIRYFTAPQTYNFNERQQTYSGGRWIKPNPQAVLNFGAIAYFFARELTQRYKIPIGIINTAIGGTPTEAWL
ncbi:sialate O-acetylesterase, partial [bacterium]